MTLIAWQSILLTVSLALAAGMVEPASCDDLYEGASNRRTETTLHGPSAGATG